MPVETCYRHPDRQYSVGCQRCDRKICSECMTSASVGHHCPECRSAGAQKVIRGVGLVSKPVFTYSVLAVIAVVFVAQAATGGFRSDGSVTRAFLLWGPDVRDNEWWRIVTSGFVHGGVMHVGFNSYLLYAFGPTVEKMVGPVRAAIIYIAGLLGGSAAVLAFAFVNSTVGASGAVLGLAGGLVAILMVNGRSLAETKLGGLLFLNLALPLIIPGISFWGHFGGIAGGFIAGYAMALAMKSARPTRTSEHGPLVQGGSDQSIVFGAVIALGLGALAIGLGVSGGL